ncbi:MAG: hypothetical protein H8E31_08700 [Planctomycetes bacterium]|nr:hypothetical protein [Planctomycetota bacterium]
MRSIVLPLLLAGCVSAPLGSDFEHARDLAARGHFDAACDFAEPLLAEAPVSDELREACGWALQADRLQDALHWGTVLLRQEPGDLDGHAARGIALLELGRPADALADLESAHRAGPARPRVQRGLGMALFQVEREPGRAQALLVLSGARDGAAAQALRKLDADLHPEPGPEAWTQAAALSRSAVCLVLERELGLSEFLARYQAEPGLSGDPGRRQDRQDEADRLIDLPADEAEARILARFVSVGLVAPDSRRFRPDQGMERGAFAWIVAELDRQVGAGADPDLGSTDDTSSFSDLSARHSDYRAARLATTLGAMRADGARRFRPSAPLSGADLEQALEPLRAVLGRSTFFAGPGGESGAVQAERVEPAAPAQQTAPEQEPAAEATAAPQGYLGEAVGRDRATATAAARQDAMARAITELHREEGLAAPLDAAARRLAELQDSLGGFLTTTTLEESWDDRTSLARVRLAVAADRAAFRREAARALRLDVQATGILSEALAARFRDRFATAGFEVVLSSAREAADARVEVSGRAEELPGGEAGFKAWRPGLAVRVLTHSHRDAARVVLLDQVFGSEDGKALYGTDATETVRQPVLAWAAEAADLAATRILDGVVSGARRTLVVQGATQRSLVADLLAAIERQGAAAGVLGTSELSFEAPYAEFQLALDRRGATRLGEILTTLQLSEGRRVRVVRAAGATLLVRIEAR